MKTKLIVIGILVPLALVGCQLFGGNSPSSIVTQFIDAAEKGDLDGMMKLYAERAKRDRGEDNIWLYNLSVSNTLQAASRQGTKIQMFDTKETIDGNNAVVTFKLGDPKGIHPVGGYQLIKENGQWKIYVDHPYDAPPSDPKPPTEREKAGAVFQLFNVYQSNYELVSKHLAGKTVAVSGYVQSIKPKENNPDQVTVELRSDRSSDKGVVICEAPQQAIKDNAYQSGDKITVKGKFAPKSNDIIVLEDCSVL